MATFEELEPGLQENVLRVLVEAEDAAKIAGHPFELTLQEVVELMENFSQLGPRDFSFRIPAGLTGMWQDDED